jgi:hypothetical protein
MVITLVTSGYAFHEWHKKKAVAMIAACMMPYIELVNIKLDMILTPEQKMRAHEIWKMSIDEKRSIGFDERK